MDNRIFSQGTFFHGTKAELKIGDYLKNGFISNYEEKRIAKYDKFPMINAQNIILSMLVMCIRNRLTLLFIKVKLRCKIKFLFFVRLLTIMC